MLYKIIREKDQKEWILENPPFVRLDSENVYCLTNESNAHAIYIEGTCYHLKGRAPIQGLDEVMIGETGEEVYSNLEMTHKLNAHEIVAADTDQLILDHEERIILLEVGE